MQRVISGRDRDNQMGMNTSPLIQTHQPEKPSSFDVIYLPPVRWQEYSGMRGKFLTIKISAVDANSPLKPSFPSHSSHEYSRHGQSGIR